MIKTKFNGYSGDGRRLYPGGGGPSSTTSYQTNIPEYARPYVEQMLGATQRQLFTGSTNAAGEFTPTGFQQYMPYGATYQTNAQGQPVRDANGQIIYTNSPMQQAQAAVAGLTPMQQQAMSGIGGYINPQQTAAASQIAGGVAGQSVAGGYYSPLVAERFQLGKPQQVYSDSFTGPGVSQAYMSPYMQNVVNAQQREARRASEIARNQQQAQAVGQGAYGGSRQAIVEAERQRNLATQLGDIQAQGLQSAYGAGMQQFNAEQAAYLQAQQANQQANLQAAIQNQQAQQAAQAAQEQSRQFGANLGLQGYGQSLQAAQLLSQQGAQEYQQDMATLQAQLQAGGLDQQQQQQVINQAIQNYATQQQYPLMQLGVMSNMLRGLPMQGVTTQAYQAQPSALSQAAGVLGTGLGLYQQGKTAGVFKKGGEVKLAPGGIATGVPEGKLSNMARMMRDQDLQAKMQDAETDPATKEIFQSETMRRQHIRGMAGGGIVAFKKGKEVKEKEKEAEAPPVSDVYPEEFDRGTAQGIVANPPAEAPDTFGASKTPLADVQKQEGILSQRQGELDLERKMKAPAMVQRIAGERQQLGIVDPMAGRREELDLRKGKIADDAKELAMSRLSEFLVRWGNTPGSALRGAVSAGQQLIADQISDTKERKRLNDQLEDSMAALNEAEYLRKTGDMDKAQARIDQAGKEYHEVAKELLKVKADLAIKQMDTATKLEIQALKNELAVTKGANKTAVIQEADAFFAAAVERGAPANKQTYAKALEKALSMQPSITAAGVATGPAYARVGLEGEKLTDVERPKAQAEVSKKVNEEVEKRLFADGKARREALTADKKAGLNANDPQSESFKLRENIRKQVESEATGKQAAAKKEEPTKKTPLSAFDKK